MCDLVDWYILRIMNSNRLFLLTIISNLVVESLDEILKLIEVLLA